MCFYLRITNAHSAHSRGISFGHNATQQDSIHSLSDAVNPEPNCI